MLSQVKKIIDPDARKDVTGRLGAWWDGRDYVPEATEPADGDAAASAPPTTDASPDGAAASSEAPAERLPMPPLKPADAASDGPRITALERMWGEGRLGPGGVDLDEQVLQPLLENLLGEGDIGFTGADAALLRACFERTDRQVLASEWRTPCVGRIRAAAGPVVVTEDDIDRPKAFANDTLAALASINTLSFADHKAGVVSRAFHALKDGGRWVILDTTRTTAKTPPTAFASAWSEAHPVHGDEIDALLEKCGFADLKKNNITDIAIKAARARMNELGAALESTVAEGMGGQQGVLFLRELVWELKSWRARLRAMEGGALQVMVWTVTKGAGGGLDEVADTDAETPAIEADGDAPAEISPGADEISAKVREIDDDLFGDEA